MAWVVLSCRLVLAGVLCVSGVAKLLDIAGATTASANLGVPRRLAKVAAVTASILELAAAALLISHAFVIGALLATALLAVFTVAVALTIRRGEHPECHCFGTLHAAPVGWKTVTRNVVLIAMGALVVAGAGRWPAQTVTDRLSTIGAGQWALIVTIGALIVAVVLEGRLILSILKQNGRLLLRLDELEARPTGDGHPAHEAHPPAGLPVGTVAPAFELPDIRGGAVSSADLLARGLPVMLVFGDAGCAPCQELLPEVAGWQRDEADRLTVALITRGDRQANEEKAKHHDLGTVLLQENDEVALAFGYVGTPGAVRIAADGTVASPVVAGAQAIRSLVRSVTCESPAPDPAVPGIGTPAPEVHLPSLSGDVVDLRSFRGSDAAVLFWNPSCGYCKKMLAELRDWDLARTSGPPPLLVVSTGSPEANGDLADLRSVVALDEAGRAMRAFGATGTPMAIRIDADGQVASTLQIGGTAVLSMLSSLVSEPVI